MDKYHIFNEIGSGRYSQVLKGRARKTTTYVAIKRVDKTVMEKVVNEVAMMHSLSHPHTLKFYDWYETRNNLWLILEYCCGGDVKALLKAEKQLPMASVKLFAGDLLAGLQYLHYSGIIYCDVKPSNILIDEHGVLKLAGFGAARRIPTATNRGKAPKNFRGTPMYLAPELWEKDGVHSFASDFWAFGCLCYELATGRTPFASQSIPVLMEKIKTTHPDFSDNLFKAKVDQNTTSILAARGTGTPPFGVGDFISALRDLLRKDPRERPTWAMIHDSFWHDVVPPPPDRPLPCQPLFDCPSSSLAAAPGQVDFPEPLPTADCEEEEEEEEAVIQTTPCDDDEEDDDDASSETDILRVSRSYQEHQMRLRRSEDVKDEDVDIEDALPEKTLLEEDPEPVARLVFASIDVEVRPILDWTPQGCSEALIATGENRNILPFEAMTVDELRHLPAETLEAHLVLSYKALVNATRPTEILGVLTYLQVVCEVTHVANVIVNSSFVSVFIQILRSGGQENLREAMLVLMCLLMRYATYIVPDAGNLEEVPLVKTLRDLVNESSADGRERQLALAALGELLFCITTQDDDDEKKNWSVARELTSTIVAFLDDLQPREGLVYYAAKTVGNIVGATNSVYTRAMSSSLVQRLAKHAAESLNDTGAAEPGRAAAIALVHLLRNVLRAAPLERRRAVLTAVDALGGPRCLSKAVQAGLVKSDDTHWQLVVLNVLNATLVVSSDAPELAEIRFHLAGDRRLASSLVRALAGPASSVRAKVAVALLQLGIAHVPTLAAVAGDNAELKMALVSSLEKLGSSSPHDLQHDRYFAASVFALVAFVADASRVLVHVSARLLLGCHGDPAHLQHLADHTLLQVFPPPSLVLQDQGGPMKTPGVEVGTWTHLRVADVVASLPLVARAAASPLLRPHLVSEAVVSDMGIIFAAVAKQQSPTTTPVWHDITRALPELVTSLVSRDAEVLAPYAAVALKTDGLLPAACGLLSSPDRDIRLTAAHLLRHTVPHLRQDLSEDLLSVLLPHSLMRLLGTDETQIEAECILRLLLETLQQRSPEVFLTNHALTTALTTAASRTDTVAQLAKQLLHRCFHHHNYAN